ncbi:MAG TPA: hypothetical protein VF251_14205 [Pyrinomonadaceae bacterium]
MNCQKFEDVVADLARGQMMETYVRTTALSHVEQCDKCNQRLSDERALMRGLQALSVQMSSMSASEEDEIRLREAMRQQRVTLARQPRRVPWLAVAAALLVIVGAIIALNWQRQTRGHKEVAEHPSAIPERAPASNDQPDKPQPLAANNESPKAAKPLKPRSHSTRTSQFRRETEAVLANHAQEIATDFIPLGNMNTASLQDGGYIVRVELPRSALVKFGLPVNMDRLDENVKADVWLGIDGLVHAIRFVQ